MGVLSLRLIDSIILPLNTTQYTLELDDYLELCVFPNYHATSNM